MTRISETTVTKEVRSRDDRGEVDVTITVGHMDSEKANDMADRLHTAVLEELDPEGDTDDRTMNVVRRNAFVAGFLASCEGFNGEYVRSGYDSPREAAISEYEKWSEESNDGS